MVVGGGMQANTETSRSSARARAATTMSILHIALHHVTLQVAHHPQVPGSVLKQYVLFCLIDWVSPLNEVVGNNMDSMGVEFRNCFIKASSISFNLFGSKLFLKL